MYKILIVLTFFLTVSISEAKLSEKERLLLDAELMEILENLPYSRDGIVFELILGSYNQVAFTLLNNSGEYVLKTETKLEKSSSDDLETVTWNKKETLKKLSKEEFKKHIVFLEAALRYNTLDDLGLFVGGSPWCLESNRGTTNITACFVSPTFHPEKRGISGLYELAKFLWFQNELTKHIELDGF